VPVRLASVTLLLAVLLGCGGKKPVAPPVARPHVPVPRCTDQLGKDPMEVTVVQREGAALVVRLGYLGGCTQHRFDACWYPAGPDDLVVVLGHDSHGEACTQWMERHLELDLSSIPEELTRGRAASGIVRLETPRRR
jgi:hypothetical protein